MNAGQILTVLIIAAVLEGINNQQQFSTSVRAFSGRPESFEHAERPRTQRPTRQQLLQSTLNRRRPNALPFAQRRLAQTTNIGIVPDNSLLRDGQPVHANSASAFWSSVATRSIQRVRAHSGRETAPQFAQSNTRTHQLENTRSRHDSAAGIRRLTRFFVQMPSQLPTPPSKVPITREPGQSLKITHSRRLIRPPQNVVRRPLVTQIHISTTPVRSTQLASAEFRPSQRAAIVPPKAFDPLSGSDNTNRFPSPTQSQTIPAPPNSFRQIQVSPALPPPAQTRISASTSPMVSAQDALARTNQSFVGQFAPAPSPLSATPLSSVVNAQPMSSPTSQPSVASQMQFRGVSSTPQQFLPAGAPNRGRSIAAPQKPISAKTRVVPQAPVAPLLPVIPLQIQRPQLLPQPVPQLPSVPATASPVQRPQIPLVPAVPIRQPAVSMQRQPLLAPRPGPEASVVQRTQAVTQPTPQRPQILPNEELIQDQLQIKHNSVGGEQELGPTPPAPQLAARPPAVGVGGDSAPGFLPPNDFVVNTLNAADDFMSVADSMQLRKRFKGDRRRRRQAESRASQLKLANSYS